ncbi:MAG TPA: RecX family transcriptional regulator [Dongiaceae bacterium]|nr:RecX family transcriptional regulator [Dongiaceae bacterium]
MQHHDEPKAGPNNLADDEVGGRPGLQEDDGKTPRRRPPPRLTPANLRQAVLDYLDRFVASAKRLDQVMQRKIKASAQAHGDDPAPLQAALPAILAGLAQQGILNDRALAEAKVRAMIRRGGSRTKIRANLAAKGIDADTADQALTRMRLEFDDPDLEAAIAYARRRRLGRFRTDPDSRTANRQKDLAAMARAGFAPSLARQALAEPEAD